MTKSAFLKKKTYIWIVPFIAIIAALKFTSISYGIGGLIYSLSQGNSKEYKGHKIYVGLSYLYEANPFGGITLLKVGDYFRGIEDNYALYFVTISSRP